MDTSNQNSKRLAKNTLFLYFRMIIIMGVTLYTSRVVLNTLGVQDFGIYNVVGGVVAMFGIVTGALSAAVSRFLNIEMGKNNKKNLRNVFSTSVFIHVFLAIIVAVLAELIGPWFIESKMTIPADRLTAAMWVFHCSIATFVINLISIPYNACIIANENMKIYAYVSILEATLKLLIVYLLVVFSIDKLQLYGILMLCVALTIRAIYQLYCNKKYAESHLVWHIDTELVKQMSGFASWNMLGSLSVIFADQGVNILLNIFCSPIVNAARGIAVQVNNAVNQFASNFMVALNPQITKSYGAQELDKYKELMTKGSKLSVIMLTCLSLPILIETDYILTLWLKEVPEHAVMFVQLILLFAISEAFSGTFTTGLLATGKIKWLMILVAGTRLMNFPISWIVLKIFGVPELTMLISIVLSQVCLLLRLVLLKKHIEINVLTYYVTVVLKMILLGVIVFAVCHIVLVNTYPHSFSRLIMTTFVAELLYIPIVYVVGLNKSEKMFVLDIVSKISKKIIKR